MIEAPIIHEISWGLIEVKIQDKIHQFKDCIIWPSGATEWDWNVTGTRHKPGTQASDLEEILKHFVEFIVLTRGMQLRLQTSPDTEELLESLGIDYEIAQTNLAVILYNDMVRQGRKVGGLFHSTC